MILPSFELVQKSASSRPPHPESTEIYELTCRVCGAMFYVHRSCYRGHAYCSKPCRHTGRRRTACSSQRTYRHSEEGRLDHRDTERARRARRCLPDAGCVGDHGSQKLILAANLVRESEVRDETQAAHGVLRFAARRRDRAGTAPRLAAFRGRSADPVCVVCGRGGTGRVRLVDGPDGRHCRAPPFATRL